MPTPLFFFFLFFLFSSSASNNRRFLHQPFLPLDAIPPSPSPPPKIPFSNTISPPNPSPFFPSFPSSPPPPPSPASFASFPANISSLVLPQSPAAKPKSQKLLAAAISAVVSSIIVLTLVLYYGRLRRDRGLSGDKTRRSDNSNVDARKASTRSNKQKKNRTTSSSSEFLHLGTLVNSCSLDETCNPHENGIFGTDPGKLDSPELLPLPPLNRQSPMQNFGNGEMGSTEDDEEEFYSPRGSLGGKESSNGTGSGSRRTFGAVGKEDFDAGISSSSSYSSSTSASPARSQSLSISPPASSSPRPKSPESNVVQAAPPSPPLMPLHNQRKSPTPSPSLSSSSLDESPRISFNLERDVLSSSASSPEKSLKKIVGSSPQISNDLDRNVRSPSLSPAKILKFSDQNRNSVSTAPDKSPICSPRVSNTVLDRDVNSPYRSSASTLPDTVLEKTPSPTISLDLDRNGRSQLISSGSSSPGIGPLDKNSLVYPLTSHVSDQSKSSSSVSSASSSPSRIFERNPDSTPITNGFGLNARISSILQQPTTVAPPPPPPPPPPPLPQQQFERNSPPTQPFRQRKQWDLPVASTQRDRSISKPPVLVPASWPFVLQGTSLVSPTEMQPCSSQSIDLANGIPKPKLKPLHWDKVGASSDREMVWDQLRSSSFKLNEEMMESLFVVNTPNVKPNHTTPRSVIPSPNQENRVLDPKKAQNIAILLRALNVTIEEVCEALLEGNTETLGTELLESLLKMAPTKEEERKLKEYKEDDSPTKLGHAEKFLKSVLDVPFAFKRVDAMLYITNFESEVEYLKRSFETLAAACEELRSSRMFLKLLEAVLKTGNRMNVGTNRGDAHAFKLDTLLKLVDVKGADGKTTLLHFVVQEIVRTEVARISGSNHTQNPSSSDDIKCRKLGLEVVSGLSSELANVKKAAAMDSDVLSNDVSKLSKGIENINEVVRLNESMNLDQSSHNFSDAMKRFMTTAEEEIIRIQAHESVALSLVKEITEYFHGNSAKEEAHPFRIFMVVRDFLGVLDRVCKEVGMINERTTVSSAHKFPVPINPTLPPGLAGPGSIRKQYSSSDDENASP